MAILSAHSCVGQCVSRSSGELPSGLDLEVASPQNAAREDDYRPDRYVRVNLASAFGWVSNPVSKIAGVRIGNMHPIPFPLCCSTFPFSFARFLIF